MSETCERQRAKAKEDTRASGAKPRPEGRVREHGWRPTTQSTGFAAPLMEAARRRAIARRRNEPVTNLEDRAEAAMSETVGP